MKKTIKIIIILLLIFLALSPWMNIVKTNEIILQRVNEKWQGIMDGCGPLRAENIKNTKRIPFGFISSIQYGCGFTTQEEAERQLENWHIIYISPFGNVIGNY